MPKFKVLLLPHFDTIHLPERKVKNTTQTKAFCWRLTKRCCNGTNLEAPAEGRTESAERSNLLQGSSKHYHLPGVLCSQEREKKICRCSGTFSAGCGEESQGEATAREEHNKGRSPKSPAGTGGWAATEEQQRKLRPGSRKNWWCTGKSNMQVTILWLYLPSSGFNSAAKLCCELQTLPKDRAAFSIKSDFFLCHRNMERTHFFWLLPNNGWHRLATNMNMDSTFVENCYLALLRLILRLNWYMCWLDSM